MQLGHHNESFAGCKSTVTGQQMSRYSALSMQLVGPDHVLHKMSAVKGQVCGSK